MASGRKFSIRGPRQRSVYHFLRISAWCLLLLFVAHQVSRAHFFVRKTQNITKPSVALAERVPAEDTRKLLCKQPISLGDAYGGWTICGPLDGQNSNRIVYSVGIGRNIQWDEAMISQFGTVHHGFDPTPTAIDFFSKRSPPPGFVFHRYGLGVSDGNVEVKLPEGNQDSFTVLEYSRAAQEGTVTTIPVLKIDSMLNMLGHESIEILKMDIEGAEFDVVRDWAKRRYSPPARQILIEFHDRYFPDGSKRLRQALDDLKGLGFVMLFKQKNWVRQAI